MISTAGQGRHLFETNGCAWWPETDSKSRTGRWFYLHGCTGCTGFLSGDGGLAILNIRKTAPDHRPSRLLVQEALVLLILCILCIDVH